MDKQKKPIKNGKKEDKLILANLKKLADTRKKEGVK